MPPRTRSADPAPTPTFTKEPASKDAEASPRVIARQVFVHVESTAKRGGLDVVALHRIPLLRNKLRVDGEVRLIGEWPENTDRRRDMDAVGLRDEYRRMQEMFIYETGDPEEGRRGDVVDLVTDFYGAPTSGRLVAVMRKLESAWAKLEAHLARTGEKFPTPQQMEEVLAVAAPENDFEDGIPYEPAAVGA
jgi:hypothetical protein